MCDMLDLLCLPYRGACDMFVACREAFKQNGRSKK